MSRIKYIGYRYKNHKGFWIYRVIQLKKDLRAYDSLARIANYNKLKYRDIILKPFKSKSYEHAIALIKGKFIK
jgi:hypothetical protein